MHFFCGVRTTAWTKAQIYNQIKIWLDTNNNNSPNIIVEQSKRAKSQIIGMRQGKTKHFNGCL